MKKSNMKLSKKLVSVAIVFTVLLGGLVTFSIFAGQDSENADQSYLVGESGNYNLGDSQTSQSGDASNLEVNIYQQGSLESNDLRLILQMSGADVAHVKMRESERILAEKETQTEEDILQEDTSVFSDEEQSEDRLEELDTSPWVNLGESGSAQRQSSLLLGESSLGKGDTQVEFGVSSSGTYYFDLYDIQGNLIATKEYVVPFGLNDSAIELALKDDYFQIRGNVTFKMAYTPQVAGVGESVTITVPPSFKINDVPASVPGSYTVSKGTVALPTEYYASVSNSQRLLDYNTANPMTAQTMTITFDPSVQERFLISFSISVIDYPLLTQLMIAYGTTPDQVPLVLTAEALNDNTKEQIAIQQYVGSSAITTVDGSAPYESPLAAYVDQGIVKSFTTIDYNRDFPSIKLPVVIILNAPEWHYPVSNIANYYPVSDMTDDLTFAAGSSFDKVTINGAEYYKIPYKWPDNISSTFQFSEQQSSYSLPNMDLIVAGKVYSIPPVYTDYTYKGVNYTQTEAYSFADYTVPNFMELILSSWSFSQTTSGNSGNAGPALDRLQGSTDDLVTFSYNNSSKYNPSRTYEDAIVEWEFPYESSPTKVSNYQGGVSDRVPLPTSISYYVYGDSTEHFVNPVLPGATTFNVAQTDHIQKVIFNYDSFPSIVYWTPVFTLNHSTVDETGASLPENKEVSIKYSFTTASGNATEQSASTSPQYVPFSLSGEKKYNLVGLADGLRFGTWSASTSSSFKNGYSTVDLLVTDQGTSSEGTNSTYVSPWQMMLKKTTSQMKDYENVVITFSPTTESEKKALSKLRGFSNSNLSAIFKDTITVYYKTNLSPTTWKTTTNMYNIPFEDGEYATELEVRLGTLSGTSMVTYSDNAKDQGEVLYFAQYSSYPIYKIVPRFDNYRTYYTGSSEEELVQHGDTLTLQAVLSTTTDAQQIDGTGGDSGFVNNTSTGTIKLSTYKELTITEENYKTTSFLKTDSTTSVPTYQWNQNIMGVFQGDSFRMAVRNSQVYSSGTWFTANVFGYKYRFYLEVNPEFEIVGMDGFNLVSITPVAGKNTRLYIYEGSTLSGLQSNFYFSGYVRPDAQVSSSTPVFVNAGYSLDPFINETLQPESGTNAYYNTYPYAKIAITSETPGFPSEWGISTTEVVNQHRLVNIDTYTKLQINLAVLDRILLKSVVEGAMSDGGAFRENQKNNLSVYGFMGNAATSDIKTYEATYYLPRAGEQTVSASADPTQSNIMLDNDFSLYLRGPVDFSNATSTVNNVDIVYLDQNNNTVTINATSSQTDLRKVRSIKITFNDFMVGDVKGIEIPVEADAVKKGLDTDDIFAYVGGASRASDTTTLSGSPTYTVATQFTYRSYDFLFRVGNDVFEAGAYDNVLRDGYATTTIYYDDNGTEKVLLTTTQGGIIRVPVNADVTRIETKPNVGYEDKIRLTIQNSTMSGTTVSTDSDFPRDTGSLAISQTDLLGQSSTMFTNYTANYYFLRKVEAADLTLVKGTTDTLNYTVSNVIIGTSFSAVAYYTLEYSDPADTSIATIANNNLAYGNSTTATGVKLGTTTYTLTVTNRLGDTFSTTGTIRVVPDYVTNPAISKKIDAGSELINSDDSFTVDAWYEGNEANKTTINNITTTPSSAGGTTFAKGATNYLQEAPAPGYENKGFVVLVDGVSIPVIDEGNGVYSYNLPATVGTLSIEVVNRNEKVANGTIKKELTTGSVALDATDTFAFEVWSVDSAGNSSAKETVNGVPVSGQKNATLTFVRDARNYINEVSKDGYLLTGFEVEYSIDGTTGSYLPLTVSSDSNGYYFDVPEQAGYLNVTAKNKNDSTSITIQKAGDSELEAYHPLYQYSIHVKADGGTTDIYQGDLEIDATGTVNNMVYGMKYVVSETNLPAATQMTSIRIVNASGAAQGTQPIRQADGSYIFQLLPAHKGATIVVENKLNTGAGLELSKQIVSSSLPKEDFTFYLEGDNGYKAYGKVAASASYDSANKAEVSWYSDIAYTIPVDVDTLPVGNYEVSETSSNTNFTLKEFQKQSGIATGGNSLTFTTTMNGTMVVATARNKAKTSGSLTINKTMDITDFREVPFTFTLKHQDTGVIYQATAEVEATGGNYGATGLVFDEWYIAGDTINYQGTLPFGVYEVTEEVSSLYDFAGFSAATGVSLSADQKVATFTINASNSSVSLSAHNDLKQAKITVDKTIVGGYGSTTAPQPQTFEFEIYGWDGTTGVLADTVSVTLSAPATTGNVVSKNLPYGKYYVVEKDQTDYNLQTGSSVVIAQGEPPSAANILTLNSAAGVNFGATNKLKTADKSFEAFKKATGAFILETGNVNTFEFEIRDVANSLLLTGEVDTTAATIESGAGILWSLEPAGTALGITVSADQMSVIGLPFGNYSITETVTGADFKSQSVSGSVAGFGSAVVGSTSSYQFTIDSASESLSETAVVFTNVLKEEGTVKVTKAFSNNQNSFPGTVFEFVLENTTTGAIYKGRTDETSIVPNWTSISNSSTTYAYDALPYGSYSISESVDANYHLVDFENTLDGSSLGTNPSFTLLSSSKVKEVTAVNTMNNDGTLDISKLFENNYNHNTTAQFSFDVYGPKTNGVMPTTPLTTVTVDSSGNWKTQISALVYGEYEIVEKNPGSEYEFVSATNGTSSVIGVDANGNSNAISVLIGQKAGQSQQGTIAVTNRVSSNGELVIGKKVEGLNPLADTLFTYTITNGLGASEIIQVKADQEVTLSERLFGTQTIVETMNEDFNFLGFEVNGGARTSADTAQVILGNGQLSGKAVSFSELKSDGSYTIRPILDPEIAQAAAGESYDFQMYRSVDGGVTWEAVKVGLLSSTVTLKPEEEYTYNGLLRGALYRAESKRSANSRYRVKDILPENGTILAGIDLTAGTATFQPLGGNHNGDVSFVIDYKRIDLVIDKYYNDTGAKAANVSFMLQWNNDQGQNIVLSNKTDANGQAVFQSLLPGYTYTLTERLAPAGAIVLQRDVVFTVSNNDTTGQLEINLTTPSNVVQLENNILHIENDYKSVGGNDGQSSTPDGNSAGGSGNSASGNGSVVGGAFVTGNDSPTDGSSVESGVLVRLPDTGGMPLWYIAFAGVGLAILGFVIWLVEKKKRQKRK